MHSKDLPRRSFLKSAAALGALGLAWPATTLAAAEMKSIEYEGQKHAAIDGIKRTKQALEEIRTLLV